jgi:hypothetical protein
VTANSESRLSTSSSHSFGAWRITRSHRSQPESAYIRPFRYSYTPIRVLCLHAPLCISRDSAVRGTQNSHCRRGGSRFRHHLLAAQMGLRELASVQRRRRPNIGRGGRWLGGKILIQSSIDCSEIARGTTRTRDLTLSLFEGKC